VTSLSKGRSGTSPGWYAILLAALLHAVCLAQEPELVTEIVDVDVVFMTSQPPGLYVTAKGQVPMLGFSEPSLSRVRYIVPPADGFQEYRLLATPPEESSGQEIEVVEASNAWPRFEEEAPWIRGVRILGEGTGVREYRLDRRVRRNIRSLSPVEIASLRLAVRRMKQRPAHDPTSWAFQANIHGTRPRDVSDPLFNQCQHGTWHFLTWHRLYIYHFEEILRDAADDPYLTLPYWDWTEEPSLPLAFREGDANTNPLYDETRTINGGATLPNFIVRDDLYEALAERRFFLLSSPPLGFSSVFDRSPHGQVHVQVGGNMGSVPTAGRDPIFWLHHCNVDRWWDHWLKSGGGRGNPSDPQFLRAQFSFAGPGGETFTHQVRDSLYSSQLGYNYDTVPHQSPPEVAIVAAAGGESVNPQQERTYKPVATSRPVPLAAPANGEDSETIEPISLGLESHRVALNLLPRIRRPTEIVAVASPEPQQILIEVSGIEFQQAPAFTYAVYLNPPPEVAAHDRLSAYRLGLIDFFSLTADHGGHPHQGASHEGEPSAAEEQGEGEDSESRPLGSKGASQTFDATQIISRLKARGLWDDSAKLSVLFQPVTAVASADSTDEYNARIKQSANAAKVTYQEVKLLIAEPE